jgi:hypothetical protein
MPLLQMARYKFPVFPLCVGTFTDGIYPSVNVLTGERNNG